MKKYILLLIVFAAALLSIPEQSLAKIGVGIGTGSIHVDEKLKPGQIYELPPVTILNTGDEEGKYSVQVAYHEKQKELRPDEKWFGFSPSTFTLKPGENQVVKIKLNLPIRMEPGDYFAYVEGYPIEKSVDGATSIGIAAATKLYFTVVPANIFQALYYKILTFWTVYAPWTNRIAIAILLLLSIGVFKRFFNININVKKSERDTQSHE